MVDHVKYLDTSATFNKARTHRYSLMRVLALGPRSVTFVGLNPSTADADKDDPTIRRCVGFARDWGFHRLFMANVHAFRSTDPQGLATCGDPVGPENFFIVRTMVIASELVICAWGANPLHADAYSIARWIMQRPHARHLGLTKSGAPRHPLYLRADTQPMTFGVGV